MQTKKALQEELGRLEAENAGFANILTGQGEGEAARALNDTEQARALSVTKRIQEIEAELETIAQQEAIIARSKNFKPVGGTKTPEEKAAEQFNPIEAARQLVSGKITGFYKEMHEEGRNMAKAAGVEELTDKRELIIPDFVKYGNKSQEEARATAASATAMGNITDNKTIFTYMDWLTPKTVLEEAGAQMVTGITGSLSLPSGDTPATYAYYAETGTASASGATAQLKSVPPLRGAVTEPVSMKLLAQSSIDAQRMFIDQFLDAERRGIETVALHGGGSNEPTGLGATTDVPVVAIGANGGVPTLAKIREMLTTLKTNNGLGMNMAWIMHPEIANLLAQLTKLTGSTETPLYDEDKGTMLGIKVLESNLLPTDLVKGSTTDAISGLVGDFTRFRIFKWAFSSMVVDPYTSATTGSVNITYNSFNNVYWPHDKSFVRCVDFTTS